MNGDFALGQTPTATPLSPTTAPNPHFVPGETYCRTDADCKSPLTCVDHKLYGWAFRSCTRFWDLWDAPEITKFPCNTDNPECGYSYRCLFLGGSTDSRRCGHLPDFVWPPGTKDPVRSLGPPPEGFVRGGPLPPDVPQHWDVRKGTLPEAPRGYMWENGRVRADLCGHCGRMCANRLSDEKPDFDRQFQYYLVPADWQCLTSTHQP